MRPRADPMSISQRAEDQIPKLRAKLESAESLRLKSHLWGTMERRERHEAALRRNLAILRRHDLAALKRVLDKTKG